MKSIDVLGSAAAIAVHREPQLRTERLERVLEWARSGALRPHVGKVFPIDSLREALIAKWEGKFAGQHRPPPGPG
jgi:hypothetical protein